MAHRKEPSAETGSDWLLPVAGIAFSTYYLYSIRELAWDAKISSVFIAVALAILSAIFLIRSLAGLVQGRLHLGTRALFDDGATMRLRGFLFLLAVAYIVVIPHAGFTLTTFAFLVVSLRFIGRMGWGHTVLWSAILALSGWGLFIAALGTRFPRGPFEAATNALFGL